MTPPASPKPEPLTFRAALRRAATDRHFLIAAAVLAVTAAGWGATVRLLEWATEKQPVTWAKPVQIDPCDGEGGAEDITYLCNSGNNGEECWDPMSWEFDKMIRARKGDEWTGFVYVRLNNVKMCD